MSSYTANAYELYDKLSNFVRGHTTFSDRVFGTPGQRGPIGPLKHIEKEAKECQEAWQKVLELKAIRADGNCKHIDEHKNNYAKYKEAIEAFNFELADLFLLLIDAMRRSGMKFSKLVDYANSKLAINEGRNWPDFDPTKADEAVEHVK